jgi:hypothetical protein
MYSNFTLANYFPNNLMGKNLADFRPYSIASVLCSLVFRHPAFVHRPRLPPITLTIDEKEIEKYAFLRGRGGEGVTVYSSKKHRWAPRSATAVVIALSIIYFEIYHNINITRIILILQVAIVTRTVFCQQWSINYSLCTIVRIRNRRQH